MTRQKYPSDTQDQFMVRFPDDMRDRIRKMAADNKRSMNSEIIDRLEKSLTKDEPMRRCDPSNETRITLRLPTSVSDGLKRMAADNNRSMNAEIVAAIEGHISRSETVSSKLDRIIELLDGR